MRPMDAKGKAKVVVEETNQAGPTLDEDVLTGRFAEKGGDSSGRKVAIEEANDFAHLIKGCRPL